MSEKLKGVLQNSLEFVSVGERQGERSLWRKEAVWGHVPGPRALYVRVKRLRFKLREIGRHRKF